MANIKENICKYCNNANKINENYVCLSEQCEPIFLKQALNFVKTKSERR
jgi:hypothetical protein